MGSCEIVCRKCHQIDPLIVYSCQHCKYGNAFSFLAFGSVSSSNVFCSVCISKLFSMPWDEIGLIIINFTGGWVRLGRPRRGHHLLEHSWQFFARLLYGARSPCVY